MNKPYIIIRTRYSGYAAFNEDGRWVFGDASIQRVQARMAQQDYEEVPLNSRLGRTIHDKIVARGLWTLTQ